MKGTSLPILELGGDLAELLEGDGRFFVLVGEEEEGRETSLEDGLDSLIVEGQDGGHRVNGQEVGQTNGIELFGIDVALLVEVLVQDDLSVGWEVQVLTSFRGECVVEGNALESLSDSQVVKVMRFISGGTEVDGNWHISH